MNSNGVTYRMPTEIMTSEIGHEILWRLHTDLQSYQNCIISFDCSNLCMIDGNMCALFMLVAENLRSNNGLNFRLIYCKPAHSDLFSRNGLMGHFHGVPSSYDNRQSVVVAKLFNPQSDTDNFCDYIERELLTHRGLSKLPVGVKDWLKLGFEETFANVAEHANTDLLATCGQLFPTKSQFHFTICDIGDGFYKKIDAYTRKNAIIIKNVSEAITWSLSGNSTREDEYSTEGGIALKRLVAHCEQNKRCSFSLITDGHNWQIKEGKVRCYALPFKTKGTTIHLIFT